MKKVTATRTRKCWCVSLFSLFLLFCVLFFYALNLLLYNSSFNTPLSVDTICTTLLLAAFTLWGAQCVGYVDHLLKSFFIYKSLQEACTTSSTHRQPRVAVFIPVFNEVPHLVKKIILKSLKIKYTNFELFLLDDSNDLLIRAQLSHLAHELHVTYISRNNRRGHKAGAINDAVEKLDRTVQYLLVLDVDHIPKAEILDDLVPLLEEDCQIAFVQTPQYFSNTKVEKIPLAYSFQQHVFHKHVCRGLDVNSSSFMCGTNLLIRLEHLKEIGGMDETCITEDIATSFLLHFKGYKSLYVDKVYAEGLSPNSLAAYFNQQMRWAYGTVQNCKRSLRLLLQKPKRLRVEQWWEYIVINGLWYFSGLTFFIWMLYTVFVLLFNIKPLSFTPFDLPLFIFIVIVGSQMFTSMRERTFRLRDLIMAQGLYYNLFPVFIRAVIYGIFSKRIEFTVTPKDGVQLIPLKKLWPHVFMLVVLFLAISMGGWKVVTGQYSAEYIHVLGWAAYNIVMLCSIFYFYIEDSNKKRVNYDVKQFFSVLED